MQLSLVEYARNVIGLADAHSEEMNKNTPYPVVTLRSEDGNHTKDGELRIGSNICYLKEKTKVREAYSAIDQISERHRNRYEANKDYFETFEEAGLIISGKNASGTKAEIIEIKDHPWFVACQFHPEFKSRPTNAHPLFKGFLRAIMEKNKSKRKTLGNKAQVFFIKKELYGFISYIHIGIWGDFGEYGKNRVNCR